MKTNNAVWFAVIAIVAVVIGFGANAMWGGQGQLSVTGDVIVDPDTGDLVAPWSNKLVNYNVITTDMYTGGDVLTTLKVYETQPEDWNDARGDFSDAVDFTTYTASSGTVSINKEMPGSYYVVATADGYNTEFFMMTIPDGSSRGDIADYQSNPDSKAVDFALVGTTTDEDFALTLVNATSKTIKDTVLLTVAENTEFRGWKVIVDDNLGFSTDTSGNGVYDEGINTFIITVGSETYTVFEPSRGVDEFDSNDEFTFMLDDIVADESDLSIKIEISADETGDFVVANDGVLGEGEGIVSYIKIYDNEGNLFSTTDLTV